MYRTLSSAGSERRPYKAEVVGSIPTASTGERRPYPARNQRDSQNSNHSHKALVGSFGTRRRSPRNGGAASTKKVKQSILHVALVVRDYDEAIEFYTKKLRFSLIEDTYQPEQDKRWVVVSPPGSSGTTLLLARASKPEQESFIGNQSGGRVFLFLQTDDFWRDYREMISRGIKFVREPKEQPYGTVAVFEDLYGNLWDLIELKKA